MNIFTWFLYLNKQVNEHNAVLISINGYKKEELKKFKNDVINVLNVDSFKIKVYRTKPYGDFFYIIIHDLTEKEISDINKIEDVEVEQLQLIDQVMFIYFYISRD